MPRPPRKRKLPPPVDFKLDDHVDQFVNARHTQLQTLADSDSEGVPSADEPEAVEREVLPFENASSSDSDDADLDDAEHNADHDWGSRKRAWYGADTDLYEIMGDDERTAALDGEEKEAILMQKDSMAALRPEDFHDAAGAPSSSDDDEHNGAADDEDVFDASVARSHAADHVLVAAAPEVPLLVAEAARYEREMLTMRESAQLYHSRAVLFHLYSAFCCNVAFYLALRTDPRVGTVDFRTHPVISRIVRIRAMLDLAIAKPLGPCIDPPRARAAAAARMDPLPVDEVDVETGEEKKKGKKKSKKEKRKKTRDVAPISDDPVPEAVYDVDDDEDVNALVTDARGDDDQVGDEAESRKRRKLNQLVGVMERERKNKEKRRMVSDDVDYVPQERKAFPVSGSKFASANDTGDLFADDVPGHDDDNEEDDDDVTNRLLAKKDKRDARKARQVAEAAKPHVYRFDDRVDVDAKRRASSQIVKNRGLTRYRPRDKKIPRTKNRLAYEKAITKRKSVVRDYVGNVAPNYAGESTGINMSARKGSKLSSV